MCEKHTKSVLNTARSASALQDFIVVVTSLIDLILVMFGETIKWTRVLRVLRVMRPLRMVKYNEGTLLGATCT